MPNNDSIQEDINSEPEIVSDSISNDIKKGEGIKNEYDQPASQKEISGFREEIEKKIEDKAGEFGISKEDLANLNDNLDSLSKEIKKRGGEIGNDELEEFGHEKLPISLEYLKEDRKKIATALKISKEDIDRIVEMIEESNFEKDIEKKSKKTGISKDVFYKFAEFDLESLSEKNLKALKTNKEEMDFIKYNIESNINKIGIENDSNKCIEYIKKHKGIISLGQLSLYLSTFGAPFIDNLIDNDVKIQVESYSEEYKYISVKNIMEDSELAKEIYGLGNVVVPVDVVSFASSDNKLEEGDNSVSFYYYNGIMRLSMSGIPEDIENLKKELGNIDSIYGGDGNWRGLTPEEFVNNKDKIAKAISNNLRTPIESANNYVEEISSFNTTRISIVPYEYVEIANESDLKDSSQNDIELLELLKQRHSINFENKKNMDLFEESFLELIKENDESIESLKNIAKEDPKKVIDMVSKMLIDNIEYDHQQKEDNQNKNMEAINERAKKGAQITLEENSGICQDYTENFMMGMKYLRNMGVPLDSVAVFSTTSDDLNHIWNVIKYIDKNDGKLKSTEIDLTWADDDNSNEISEIPKKLNAVDDKHYYKTPIKIIEETHEKIIEKIKSINNFIKQEKCYEDLIQYDIRSHKRDQQIEGNEELQKQNKDAERTREEKTENVRSSLKRIRDKLENIYSKKSEDE